jgi:membrane-associated phospholipid phosphatase
MAEDFNEGHGAAASGGADPAATALVSGLVSREKITRWLRLLIAAPETLPVVLIETVALICVVWNARVGLTWTPSFLTMATPAILFLTVTAFCLALLPRHPISEIALYFGLYATFGLFALRLTYLTATLDFPLQDKLFASADSALGCDWRAWSATAWSHPTFISVLSLAYDSFRAEPFLVICVLALRGPPRLNSKFMVATIVALLTTVAIGAVMPAFGPNEIYGIPSAWSDVLHSLRAGSHSPLKYVGIITFPSFHATMAVMWTLAMREMRYGFYVVAFVNGLMLLACMPLGYHYLVDVIVGGIVAFGSLRVARFNLKQA